MYWNIYHKQDTEIQNNKKLFTKIMSISKQKAQIKVRSILDVATMKFRPKKIYCQQSDWKVKNIITQLQSKVKIKKQNSPEKHEQIPVRCWHRAQLKYIQKLSQTHFLIGNENQLDLIQFCPENKDFLQTQFVWDFQIGKEIQHLCVDNRKCYFVVSNDKNFYVYKYDIKNNDEPTFLQAGITTQKILSLQFAKQSILTCFCKNHFEVYSLSEDGIKLKYKESYKLTEQQSKKFSLYQVPPAFQQTVKVFFKDDVYGPTFNLSCVNIQFLPTTIKIDPLVKLYDIKKTLINSKLENYSKEFVMMNLDHEIEILKDGYILDTINVNLSSQNSILKYLGNHNLLHLSDKKIELYNFTIDKYSRPQRIILKPQDSIAFTKPPDSTLLDAIQTAQGNFALFFQIEKQKSTRIDGQVIYFVTETQRVQLSEKIRVIFTPQNIQSYQKEPSKLAEQIDIAQKMGLSKKQIFYQLWLASPKETERDQSFLLATEDYQTISDQIQKKLKKKSISLKNLMNLQQSCLSILRQKLQKNCSEKIIQEYISCHFFYRKLKYIGNILKFQKEQNQQIQQMQQSMPVVKNFLSSPQYEQKHSGMQQQDNNVSKINDQFKLFINIQQYLDLKEMNIKQRLIKLIDEFCQEDIDNTKKIRELLAQFKFIFRIQYRSILEEIITTAKYQLVKLLKVFPILLPFYPNVQSESMFEGIWGEIKNQWQNSLYLNTVETIDNAQQIKQFTNKVWFKRNKLKKHDFVTSKKKQIQQHIEKQSDQSFFYFFIAKVVEQFAIQYDQDQVDAASVENHQQSQFDKLVKQQRLKNVISSPEKFNTTNLKLLKEATQNQKNKIIMQDIVKFCEYYYDKLPEHLKGKVFLYDKLYRFLKDKKILPQVNGQPIEFQSFLKFKDPQLFKHFFKKQRNIKGLILKHIKCIFESQKGGKKYFNDAILNYFADESSQVSDLKYILNRINNEKKDYHQKNKTLCDIFVQAMMMKIKLGSKNDIPIQQVLIYIERLPIGDDQSKSKKSFILTLQQKSGLFKEMKLNMSLGEIYKNREEVIIRLTLHYIAEKKIFSIIDQIKFKNQTLNCLGSIQYTKGQLYPDFNDYLHFYVFMCELLKKQSMIEKAARFIKNQINLRDHYKLIFQDFDNIVLLMYRWKFSKDPIYIHNTSYILKLTKILELQYSMQWKDFLQSQMRLAKLLSQPRKPVQYPISAEAGMPTINDFYRIIWDLSCDFLLELNLQEVSKQLSLMEQMIQNQIPVSPNKNQMKKRQKKSSVDLYHIYQAVILKLIDTNEVKALRKIADKIKKMDDILVPNMISFFNPVFTIIYVLQIVNTKELSADCNRLLIEILFFCLKQPLQIIEVIQKMFKQKYDHEQRKRFLYEQKQKLAVEQGNKLLRGKYVNGLYTDLFKNILENDEKNAQYLIEKTIKKIKETKDEFMTNYLYETVIRILLINPIILPKFLYIQKQSINWTKIRLLLSYLTKFIVFDIEQLLMYGLKMFEAMRKSYQYHIYIQEIINDQKKMTIEINEKPYDIDNIIQLISNGQLKIPAFVNKHQPNTFGAIISECSHIFLTKIETYVRKKKEAQQTILLNNQNVEHEDVFNFKERNMSFNDINKIITEQRQNSEKKEKNKLQLAQKQQKNILNKSHDKKHKYPFLDKDDEDLQQFLTIKQIAPRTIPGFKHKQKKIKQYDLKKEMIAIINKKQKNGPKKKKNRQQIKKFPKQNSNTFSVRLSSPGARFEPKSFINPEKRNKINKQKLQEPIQQLVKGENSISYVQAQSNIQIQSSSIFQENSKLGNSNSQVYKSKGPNDSYKNIGGQLQESQLGINLSIDISNYEKSHRFKKKENDSLGSDEKSNLMSDAPILDTIKEQGANQLLTQSPPTRDNNNLKKPNQIKICIPKDVKEKLNRSKQLNINLQKNSKVNSQVDIQISMNLDVASLQQNNNSVVEVQLDLNQSNLNHLPSNRISPPPKMYENKHQQTQQKNDEKQMFLDPLGNPPAINLNQTSSYFSNNVSIGSSFEEEQQKIILAFIQDNQKFLKTKPSEDEKIQPNLILLEHLKKNNNTQKFSAEAKTILNKIYESSLFAEAETDKKTPASTRPLQSFFQLLKIIHVTYPQIGLNPIWINAYKQGVQKYGVIPINFIIRRFFVFKGVYSLASSSLELYQQIKQDINPFINQRNYIKVANLMALALKETKIQSLIYLSYIKKLVKSITTQFGVNNLDLSSQRQEQLEKKQTLLIEISKKINSNFLLQNFEQIFRNNKKGQRTNKLIKNISEILLHKLQDKSNEIKKIVANIQQQS